MRPYHDQVTYNKKLIKDQGKLKQKLLINGESSDGFSAAHVLSNGNMLSTETEIRKTSIPDPVQGSII